MIAATMGAAKFCKTTGVGGRSVGGPLRLRSLSNLPERRGYLAGTASVGRRPPSCRHPVSARRGSGRRTHFGARRRRRRCKVAGLEARQLRLISTDWRRCYPANSGTGSDDAMPSCRVSRRGHDGVLAASQTWYPTSKTAASQPPGRARLSGGSGLSYMASIPGHRGSGPAHPLRFRPMDWSAVPQPAQRMQAQQLPPRRSAGASCLDPPSCNRRILEQRQRGNPSPDEPRQLAHGAERERTVIFHRLVTSSLTALPRPGRGSVSRRS